MENKSVYLGSVWRLYDCCKLFISMMCSINFQLEADMSEDPLMSSPLWRIYLVNLLVTKQFWSTYMISQTLLTP